MLKCDMSKMLNICYEIINMTMCFGKYYENMLVNMIQLYDYVNIFRHIHEITLTMM